MAAINQERIAGDKDYEEQAYGAEAVCEMDLLEETCAYVTPPCEACP